MVQLHVADDVAQRGGGQVLNGGERALHAVGKQLRVGDLEEHHGVDLHGHVIAGDHRLGLKVHDLLLEGDFFGDARDKRRFEMEACLPCGIVHAQALYNIGISLGNDGDVRDEDHERQHN